MRHEILRMLENNSRIDLHDLAIMLGTDESVVLEEIEKMENEGIICGYPTPVSYTHLDVYKRQVLYCNSIVCCVYSMVKC